MEKDEGLPFSCLSLWRWAASEWIRLVSRCSVSLYSSLFSLSLSHTPPPPPPIHNFTDKRTHPPAQLRTHTTDECKRVMKVRQTDEGLETVEH